MTIEKRDVVFKSGETIAAAWFFLPDGAEKGAPVPAVAMAHGTGAVTTLRRFPASSRIQPGFTRESKTSAASGRGMYVSYCASCHGTTGKGDGPAATALKSRPADLTRLSASHGGKYPSDYVANILQEETQMASHGSADMPIWGPIFRSVSSAGQEEVRLRMYNLNQYLASLNKSTTRATSHE
jgi:mono/diheme cytochrome c family protein